MHVSHLSIQNFRSYSGADLALGPGVTTFIGRNGAGKTNLIESLQYVSSLSSHRVSTDAPLVRSGAPTAVVRAAVVKDDRQALIEIEIAPGRANRARLNRSPLSRPRDVLGILRTVLFAPEDLALVKGDPSERRRFLDDLLIARAPRWAGVRADYDRVLKQRNALLKSIGSAARGGRVDLSTLDVWDASLARTGAALLAGRLELVAALRPLVNRAYTVLASPAKAPPEPAAGPPGCDLIYRSSIRPAADLDAAPADPEADLLSPDPEALEAEMLAALTATRSREMDRGLSLVGPHRDELLLTLGRLSLPAKGYASHGESWSCALALRLAAYDLLRSDGGEPVLILDDVFAELDLGRRDRLATILADAEQVLITAADPEDVPQRLGGRRIDVPAAVLVDVGQPQ